MKQLYLKIILFSFLVCSISLVAQTNHQVLVANMSYTPSDLTIEIGDQVTFILEGGMHDVNFNISMLTGEPFDNPYEITSLPMQSEPGEMGTITFDVPGTYNYDCTNYGHASMGMVGSITVNPLEENITADLFVQPSNTGANMTVAINSSSFDQFEGGQIGAFYDLSGDGILQCVGLEQISIGFFGLALWGDDSFTSEIDGLSVGAVPQFAILFEGNVIMFNELPEFTGFETNGIFFVTDTDLPNDVDACLDTSFIDISTNPFLPEFIAVYYDCFGNCVNDIDFDGICDELDYIIYGCTDETAYNYNPNATEDDESCIYEGVTCQINWPSEPLNSELNSTYIIESVLYENEPAIYSKIGAFFTNDQGELQCGGWNNWANQLQTIAVWEDDELTNEKDGFYEGEVITWFATNDGGLSTHQVSVVYTNSDDTTAEEAAFFRANTINRILSINISNFTDCDINILGCTDYDALNYNPISNVDDGTCIPIIEGCTNPDAENYDELANYDNGICIIYGCTDELFAEYSPDANFDDGSCNNSAYFGCTDDGAINYNSEANVDDDSCIFIEDIIDSTMFVSPIITGINMTVGFNDTLLDQFENGQIGAFFDLENDGDLQCVGLVYIQNGFFTLAIWGDDVSTQEQDGLSSGDIPEFAILYEGNVISFSDFEEFNGYNTNEVVIIDEIDLTSFFITGCTDSLAFNFNSEATFDDGSCELFVYGCTDSQAINYNAFANSNDETCIYEEITCEINWPTEVINTGINSTYVFQDVSFNNDNLLYGKIGAFFINNNNELQCGGWQTWTNFTTSIAVWGDDTTTPEKDGFYDGEEITWLASNDEGITTYPASVTYTMSPYGEGSSIFYANSANIISEFAISGTEFNCEIYGCTDHNACNYDLYSYVENGSCVFAEPYYNCDSICINDSDSDGICNELEVSGCTDPTASNFNINASDDDGGCIFNGCTYINACNYNSVANYDDGSCFYAETYYNCDGTCINDNDGNGICDELEISEFCEQSQWLLPYEGNTGSNMTLLLQETFVFSLNTQTNNAYIVASTENGLIVGSSYLNNSQTSIAIWGDDSFTPEIDGATDGQLINLHLIDSNQLFNINISFNYITNNFDVISNEVSPVLTCIAENLGCTDENACNYNAESIIEDGSCTYSETYFDCNDNCINDIDTDGVCDELEVLGCTDQESCNWNEIATENDSSCIYPEIYFDCDSNCINDFDLDFVCDELEIYGCTYTDACNYNVNATDDDGSCFYAEWDYDCDGNCINDADQDEVCDEEDNCLEVVNPYQEDSDNDGEGDACDYDDGIGIGEISEDIPTLIKMIDVLGREYNEHKKGMLLFYIYENGKVEKRVIH